MDILPEHIDKSWEGFFSKAIMEELQEIERQIGTNYNPTDPKKILRFLSVPLDGVKVIWLGQDVYPAKGVATGRSFEIGGLDSWHDPFRQASLRNIIRLIHKNYHHIEAYDEIKKFQEIREDIQRGDFPIKAPAARFASLEKQGVLFLNSAFTCEVNIANSHKDIWQHFSNNVLHYISEHRPDILWFLWGKEAMEKKAYITNGIFLESRHPSRCSEKYTDDFLKFSGFKQTMDNINWLG